MVLRENNFYSKTSEIFINFESNEELSFIQMFLSNALLQ